MGGKAVGVKYLVEAGRAFAPVDSGMLLAYLAEAVSRGGAGHIRITTIVDGVVHQPRQEALDMALPVEHEPGDMTMEQFMQFGVWPLCLCGHRKDRHKDDGDPRGGGCWECSCVSYRPAVAKSPLDP